MYKNVQHYRHTVHLYLDELWRSSSNPKKARSTMYKTLSTKMNLPVDDTHVAKFTRAQCREAIKVLRPMYIQFFGRDLLPNKSNNVQNTQKAKQAKKGKVKQYMSKIRITRHEEFEVAHLLPGHEKGCGRLHGHTYKIEVTVEGTQKEPWGMIMDFGDLKTAIKECTPDHKFVYNVNDDEVSKEIAQVLTVHDIQFQPMPFMTTAENMVGYYAETIDNYIKNELGLKDVDVVEVKLWETSNSYATWIK